LTAVWVLGTLAVAGLFYKNTSLIRADNNNSLRQYALLVTEGLPPKGAIVLSDYSQQMYLTQAALTDNGHANDYLLVDTPSLVYPRYHSYLHQKSPEKWPLLISPQETNILSGIGLAHMLTLLSASNQLCYLHPNEGILFEEFYQESHGLITELKKLPDATLLPPAPDQNLIAENQKFWAAAQADSLAPVEDRLEPPDRNAAESPIQRLLDRLHTAHEEDVTAIFIGTFCSRALNSWGVDLQRAGEITNAAGCFQTALQLNPDNIAAQVNLQVNGDLQARHLPALDFSKTADTGKFTSLADVIKTDGPFDDPAFCYLYGSALVDENGLYRQAVAPLERVRQLAPSFITARVLLARIYAMNHLPDKALDAMRELLNRPADFSINDSDLAGLKILAAAAYFQKNDLSRGSSLLEAEISRDPTNDDFLASVLKVYIGHDMFTNALIVVDNRLRLSPDNPNWLYTKGYLENQMKEYSKAIEVFNKVLTIQKDNPHAIFQRGNAYMGNGNLEAARADYEKLQQLQTNSFQMAFLLGDIAWRQHNTNETIRNFQIYMANAPTNEPHMQTVTERLGELKQPASGQ
jgi:tetratricopeptide (TPR) repeat protein